MGLENTGLERFPCLHTVSGAEWWEELVAVIPIKTASLVFPDVCLHVIVLLGMMRV